MSRERKFNIAKYAGVLLLVVADAVVNRHVDWFGVVIGSVCAAGLIAELRAP